MDLHTLLPTKQSIESIMKHEVQELPAFPAVATKILELIRDERSSAEDIAKVIESDPAITASVLRIVNSAYYGFHRRISSISQAIALLGLSTIRQLALGTTVFDRFVKNKGKVIFDRISFWKHCLAVAGLSMAISEVVNYPKSEEAYVAGLLHDIGKIILDVYGRISYGEFLNHIENSINTRIQDERAVIGLSHDEIGSYFCSSWGLPDILKYAIRLHHQKFSHLNLPLEQNILISIVTLANFIATSQGLGSDEMVQNPYLHPDIDKYIHLSQIDYHALLQRMDLEIKRTADLYQFKFPTAGQFRTNLLLSNIELARNSEKGPSKAPDNEPKESGLLSITTQFGESKQELTPEKLMVETLQIIHKEVNFERFWILKISVSRRALITVKSLDALNMENILPPFEFPLNSGSGKIIECLRTNVPAIIRQNTKIESDILSQLSIKEMGIVPFYVDNKIGGVLAIDNYATGRPIKATDLALISENAEDLGLIFKNLHPINQDRFFDDHDGLTKLKTKIYVEKLIKNDISEKSLKIEPTSCAFILINQMDEFYLKFGHLEADSLIKLMASAIVKNSRPSDIVGRFENEEYIVILKACNHDGASTYARRVTLKLKELSRSLIRRFPGFDLSIRIRIVEIEESIHDLNELSRTAQNYQIESDETEK